MTDPAPQQHLLFDRSCRSENCNEVKRAVGNAASPRQHVCVLVFFSKVGGSLRNFNHTLEVLWKEHVFFGDQTGA